jgi:uncharacterized protein YggT (Ycf19 family)
VNVVLAVSRVTIANYVSTVFYVYSLAIFAYIISMWVFALGVRIPYSGPVHAVLGFLRDICEPFLGLFRRFLPPIGGLDLSPMVALLVLLVGRSLIVNAIAG